MNKVENTELEQRMITSVASPVHLTPTSSSWAASQHTTPTSSALSHVSPSQNTSPPLNLTPVAQPNDERLPPRRGDDPFPHAAIRCVPPCRIPDGCILILNPCNFDGLVHRTQIRLIASLLHPSHIHNDPSRCRTFRKGLHFIYRNRSEYSVRKISLVTIQFARYDHSDEIVPKSMHVTPADYFVVTLAAIYTLLSYPC